MKEISICVHVYNVSHKYPTVKNTEFSLAVKWTQNQIYSQSSLTWMILFNGIPWLILAYCMSCFLTHCPVVKARIQHELHYFAGPVACIVT